MAPTYTTLTDIKEEFTKSWKRYLDDCFIFWIGRHQRIAQPTKKLTPQNKIYYATQLKRITIFRHPYKNVNGQIIIDIYHNRQTPSNISTSEATTPKTIKSIPYMPACRIHTIITDKNLKKHASKNYTQPYTREDIQQY